jgi:ketosteroid isomerase-like protein
MDRPTAERFAAEWIAAWNAHDLDAILAHYGDDVVFHSPRITVVTGEAIASVTGKDALARYWSRALAGAPDLRFTLTRVYVGSDALAITYRNHRGEDAVETFVFAADGRVAVSVATYG